MLQDGRRVRLRRALPGDESALRAAFAQLAPDSRRRRFLSSISHRGRHPGWNLEAGAMHDEAWIALDADASGEFRLGIAEYVRLPREPGVAEIAIAITGFHSHPGLGRLLLTTLSRAAGAHGIDAFRAYVFRATWATVRSLQELGATIQYADGGMLCFDVPLVRASDAIPETPSEGALSALAQWIADNGPIAGPGPGKEAAPWR